MVVPRLLCTPGSDVQELYDIDEGVLGEGIQGVVRTVVHKKTGLKYAMKTVPLGAGQVRCFGRGRRWCWWCWYYYVGVIFGAVVVLLLVGTCYGCWRGDGGVGVGVVMVVLALDVVMAVLALLLVMVVVSVLVLV